MSGAPVLDKDIDRVVGIISEHYRSQSDVDNNLSFAILVGSIIRVCPSLKEKNRGLRKFNNFLKAIRKSGLIYDKFEDLYVAPIEYDEIIKNLKEKNIISLFSIHF